jgi:hypothetical protein
MTVTTRTESLDKTASKMKVGVVFIWNGRMWRRGRGIIYRAHPADWIIERAYLKRNTRYTKRMKARVERELRGTV